MGLRWGVFLIFSIYTGHLPKKGKKLLGLRVEMGQILVYNKQAEKGPLY